MDWQHYSALLVFAIIFYGTPGPATMSLAASGSIYGFRRSIPYLLGIIAGLFINLIVAAFGVGVILTKFPLLYEILKYVSLGYIIYLACKIAASAGWNSENIRSMRFLQGLILNVLNPKAYIAAIAILTQFGKPGDSYVWSSSVIITTIMVIGILVDLGWCGSGEVISRLFSSNKIIRGINIALAILMVISMGVTVAI